MIVVCVVQYVKRTPRIIVELAPSLSLIPEVPGLRAGSHTYYHEAFLIF